MPAKLLAWALVLTAVILSQNVMIIASIYITLAAMLLATGLPARQVLGLAAYPVVFALLFALSQLQEAGLAWGLLIVARATTAALDTVLLIATTPYPQVFAFVQRFVPSTIGDGLFMAYRSAFILMDKFQHLIRAVRLRGGFSGKRLAGNARNVGVALGTLMIDSVDYSQRLYAVMQIRGYEKRISARLPAGRWTAREAMLAAGALLLLALSAVFRVYYRVLNPVSWLPVLLALSLLGWQGVRSWSR